MNESAVSRPLKGQPGALGARADANARDWTRRLLVSRRTLWRIAIFTIATTVASLIILAHGIQFFLDRVWLHFLPASRRTQNSGRLYRGEQRKPRPLRPHRDYYIFLKHKVTRRMPALFRYHHSVWTFRIRNYTRPSSLRNLLRFSILKTPAAADLRRLILRHSDRLGCLNQYPPTPLRYAPLPVLKCCYSRLPKVAIVTPSYNQAHFLEETMRSVLDNGYPSLEYAVVDGGSQDETPLILERYSHRLIYWVSEPDRGQSHAIQKGFRKLSGEVMGYLNSDDILLPGALHLVATYFATHPDVDVVYGHRILVNASGLEIGRWILPPHSNEATRRADYIPQETLFWRSQLYWRAGGVDTSFRFAIDWDLILRFQAAGGIFHRLPYFLACFRVHDSQKTSSIKESVGEVEVELLRKRELGKDRSSWNLQKHDQEIKHRAFITELAAKCGCRSTRL